MFLQELTLVVFNKSFQGLAMVYSSFTRATFELLKIYLFGLDVGINHGFKKITVLGPVLDFFIKFLKKKINKIFILMKVPKQLAHIDHFVFDLRLI